MSSLTNNPHTLFLFGLLAGFIVPTLQGSTIHYPIKRAIERLADSFAVIGEAVLVKRGEAIMKKHRETNFFPHRENW